MTKLSCLRITYRTRYKDKKFVLFDKVKGIKQHLKQVIQETLSENTLMKMQFFLQLYFLSLFY